jgi:integrase
LESLGVTVPRFEEIVSTALERIREAHEHAAKITVADAVESFIAYKKARVGTRQLTDLETRLTRFAKDLGDRSLASITTAEIEEWIGTLKSRKNPDKLAEAPLLAPLSRNHYRANLANLFAYGAAPARAWCPRNPIEDLEPERVEMTEPEAYSPEDVAKIMEAALARKPELVPVLSLGMFCGLRVSEALAIELSKIRQGTDEFRVTGKTGPRMVPLTDAARAWLFAQDRKKGKAWLKSERHFVDAIQELFTIAGVQQIDNGARHSFISYRTAETRDVARVADECGNSVSTIKNHYRQLVTAADAATFFSIRPESAGKKVVQIEEGRGVA